jgi:hypothetical protein
MLIFIFKNILIVFINKFIILLLLASFFEFLFIDCYLYKLINK